MPPTGEPRPQYVDPPLSKPLAATGSAPIAVRPMEITVPLPERSFITYPFPCRLET